jgi:hypothetical protein
MDKLKLSVCVEHLGKQADRVGVLSFPTCLKFGSQGHTLLKFQWAWGGVGKTSYDNLTIIPKAGVL